MIDEAQLKIAAYQRFIEAKVCATVTAGFDVELSEISSALKPHQRTIVKWMVAGGRRLCAGSFGLGKTAIQLETCRIILDRAAAGARGLITIPLGVRQEFTRDALKLLGWKTAPRFVQSWTEILTLEEADPAAPRLYLTNWESVRDGKFDPSMFTVTSFDEADALRSFGSKTFGEVLFGGWELVPYRFVATATPDPNEYLELLGYAQFLGVMDIGQAKTRFFKRDSQKADRLTLHAHKEAEFWGWVSTFALFIQRPSDICEHAHLRRVAAENGDELKPCACDEGYALPELDVRWHEIGTNHEDAGAEKSGQRRMYKSAAHGITAASREKRDSLALRIAKMLELRAEDPAAHRIIWHDLEAERKAIEKACPDVATVFGSQELEERERIIVDFSDGRIQEMAAKPVMLAAGGNFQRHCSWAIFLGFGFKFRDLIQAIHRLYRFLQTDRVRIDLIYTEAERPVRRSIEEKWARYKKQTEHLSRLIREHGLAENALASTLTRSMGVERREIKSRTYTVVNNDCVLETIAMKTESVDLVLTSPPFSNQYEYTPSYNDFGHTDGADHFWQQMDALTPELLRVLKPGRLCLVHLKDRIVDSGMSGLGFQVVDPTHATAIVHFKEHGFAYLGMKTIVTDVVRENNQTYRLGYSEQCKDGARMGVGMPEYLLLFRKPQTDKSRGYSDVPVVKSKAEYSRARWQYDAHGFERVSGDRLLTPEEISKLPWGQVFKLFREYSSRHVYNFERDVALAEALENEGPPPGRLPTDFMLMPPVSWHRDVWTDVTRMRTLNGAQSAKGREKHLCPLPFDIVKRAIVQCSNVGDVVYDPFGGVGTVPALAVELGRIGYAVELNGRYTDDMAGYCQAAEDKVSMPSLFDDLPEELTA